MLKKINSIDLRNIFHNEHRIKALIFLNNQSITISPEQFSILHYEKLPEENVLFRLLNSGYKIIKRKKSGKNGKKFIEFIIKKNN